MDASPHQIHATLLDQDEYPCSIRTMYRLLLEKSASVAINAAILSNVCLIEENW